MYIIIIISFAVVEPIWEFPNTVSLYYYEWAADGGLNHQTRNIQTRKNVVQLRFKSFLKKNKCREILYFFQCAFDRILFHYSNWLCFLSSGRQSNVSIWSSHCATQDNKQIGWRPDLESVGNVKVTNPQNPINKLIPLFLLPFGTYSAARSSPGSFLSFSPLPRVRHVLKIIHRQNRIK